MDRMTKEDVRRTRAAYGLPATKDIGPQERDGLATLLLSGEREYNLTCTEFKAWQAAHEDDFLERQRKRQAAASAKRATMRAKPKSRAKRGEKGKSA